MAVLRRRGRGQERHERQDDPRSGLDLDAVAEAVLAAASAGHAPLGGPPTGEAETDGSGAGGSAIGGSAIGGSASGGSASGGSGTDGWAELVQPPEPVLGYGPDAYRVHLATDDPRWAGTLLARTSDARTLRREAAFVSALDAAGFPVPELVTTPDDDRLLVFRQPPGDSLASVMVANVTSVPQFLAAFGALHARLHGLPTDGTDRSADAGPDPLDELAEHATPEAVRAEVAPELAWLRAHRPADGTPVVCHSELSPAYVHLRGTDTSTAVPVNWTRARLADPAYDVAGTVTAFWSVPIYVDNALHRKALKLARDSLVSAYLSAYREAAPHPLDDDKLAYWQAFHLAWLATDIARRLHGVNGPWEAGTIVAQPESTFDDVRARFRDFADVDTDA
jgi:Phosphotransferase enzyme family